MLGIGIVQVDGQRTWRLFQDQIQVIAKFVAQLAELGFPLVFQAKSECLEKKEKLGIQKDAFKI